MAKKNNFTVYPGKILVSRIEADPDAMLREERRFEEMGLVEDVGKGVTFVKKGDIVFYVEWAELKTPEINGKNYVVVPCDDESIIGKLSNV